MNTGQFDELLTVKTVNQQNSSTKFKENHNIKTIESDNETMADLLLP